MSVATTLRICAPSATAFESQLKLYGADVINDDKTLSTKSSTFETPLSSDAVTSTETISDTVAPSVGKSIDTVGGLSATGGGGGGVSPPPPPQLVRKKKRKSGVTTRESFRKPNCVFMVHLLV